MRSDSSQVELKSFAAGTSCRAWRRTTERVDDIVGIKVKDEERGERALVCWGRVFDPVDRNELFVHVRRALPAYGFHNVVEMELCYDVGELQGFRYLFEALFSFSVTAAQFGGDLQALREKLRTDEDFFRSSLFLLGERRDEITE